MSLSQDSQPSGVHHDAPSQLSVSYSEDGDTSDARLEIAEYTETKTVTTTTTTKKAFPPMFLGKGARPLSSLDPKEYPLARTKTPAELASFTIDLEEGGMQDMSLGNDSQTATQPSQTQPDWSFRRFDDPSDDHEGRTTPNSYANRLSSRRRPLAVSAPSLARSPPYKTKTPGRSRSERFGEYIGSFGSSSLRSPDESRRESVAGSSRQRAPPRGLGFLATPDANDVELTYSTNVATPPVADYDAGPFGSRRSPSAQQVAHVEACLPRSTIESISGQDASLPSPRLSPTLGPTQPTDSDPNASQLEHLYDEDGSLAQALTRQSHTRWMGSSQQQDEAAESSQDAVSQLDKQLGKKTAGLLNARALLSHFDALSEDMQSFMMYQLLRRSSRKQLRWVAATVNGVFKCDFLQQLPIELGFEVLSHLGHRDLCRVAQVSKHWRNMADSNETGWKELFERDGFQLTATELDMAIQQGWGWQNPEGPEGVERDLSLPLRSPSAQLAPTPFSMSASEWVEQVYSSSPPPGWSSRPRAEKRKREAEPLATPSRTKRRIGPSSAALLTPSLPRSDKIHGSRYHKSRGPMAAANAGIVAVPDPQIGLSSLRRFHLYKSLYRRHYMIRQSWTSKKVKPSHVAFAAHPRHVITCLQFDDDKIITGSDDTLINVYDTKTGALRNSLQGHEGGVWALQYIGNTLVSGSTDRSVRVWDIEQGHCTQVFYGHTSTVRCLQILMPTPAGVGGFDGQPVMMPSKPLIITGSRDAQLRVWKLPEPGSGRIIQNPNAPIGSELDCPYYLRTLGGHTLSVRSIAAHGDTLVSGSYDSTVRVWRISTGECVHVLTGHTQKVYSVVLDHERNRCVSGSMDSLVKIWDLSTGACLYNLEGHLLLVGLLDLREQRLVSAAADASLRVWDPDNGRCKHTLMAHSGAITCFQHDAAKIISGSEKTVKMWDIQTGDHLQDLLEDLGGVWQVKFDHRRCVAAVQRDNLTYIEILDFGAVRDGVPLSELGKRKLLNPEVVQGLVEEEA